MSRERIFLFDTTLRDGAQTQGVDFSVEDKRLIATTLDRMGVDYVEGGWPGANPTDTAFFADAPRLERATFTAFGMTRRSGRSVANDPGLAGLIEAATPAICIVGKTWDFHVHVALEIALDETSRSLPIPSATSPLQGASRCLTANISLMATRPIPTMRFLRPRRPRGGRALGGAV